MSETQAGYMAVIHTAYVPMNLRRRDDEMPRIYARVQGSADAKVLLVSDPGTDEPIDTDAYEGWILAHGEQIARESLWTLGRTRPQPPQTSVTQ